jgi:hypothetical protein
LKKVGPREERPPFAGKRQIKPLLRLTIRGKSDKLHPVYSEEAEKYPRRSSSESPWAVRRGERAAANTLRSWHPNGRGVARPSRRAPGAPVTAQGFVGTPRGAGLRGRRESEVVPRLCVALCPRRDRGRFYGRSRSKDPILTERERQLCRFTKNW